MKQDILKLRHSAAHLLAHAVSELFPGTLLTIGPATEEGFFYDCLPIKNFKEEDLVVITERMRQLANKDIKLEHREISKDEARKIFGHNPFKMELIDLIPGDTVGLATQGDFLDLCRGGHVESTGQLKNFKLTGISGSYWRANRENQPLQRISGIVFFTPEDLEAHERLMEDLQLYDHRRLGKQLDYFSFQDEGVGFPFFHPRGKKIINILMSYMRAVQESYNYQEIETPTMLSDELWRCSGHYAHYKDNMYFSCIDDRAYALKPMNCPGSILVYKNRPRSYRELPLKLSEFGHVHRHELSGVLNGLKRVRAFTQDDVHIYCTMVQVEQQIKNIVEMLLKVFKRCGFETIKFAISTRPENSLGENDPRWEQATNALKNALENLHINYELKPGEGAFYGPKIEMHILDSMGRSWQCGTAQVDLFQPENFDLSFVNDKGEKERPVIIHSTIYGSMERFFGILLEHHKGNLPAWLSPLQARVMPITDEQRSYGESILHQLKQHGVRADIDLSSDPLSGQIKSAQAEKIPLMIIVGKKEMEMNTITLRLRDNKQESGLSISQLLEKLDQINNS
jgi:threonyl-tRNA synthetase